MKDRIKELWDKSKSSGVHPTFGEYDMYSAEKFAELIVRETINEMIRQLWNYGIDESNNPSFYKAVERTEEHFGVEE
jgi:hypothetical protein